MLENAAEVTMSGPLDMQVCVPESWTDGEILFFAEREHPCGTENGWSIRKKGSRFLAGVGERVPCEERDRFVHVMLDA